MNELINRGDAINAVLIDGKKAMDTLEEAYNDVLIWDEDDDWSRGIKEGIYIAMSHLSALPAVDAVEVIRCKDCKHYETHGHRCKVWNHGVIVMGYCYRTERNTDG